jgi:hypothetical protein
VTVNECSPAVNPYVSNNICWYRVEFLVGAVYMEAVLLSIEYDETRGSFSSVGEMVPYSMSEVPSSKLNKCNSLCKPHERKSYR